MSGKISRLEAVAPLWRFRYRPTNSRAAPIIIRSASATRIVVAIATSGFNEIESVCSPTRQEANSVSPDPEQPGTLREFRHVLRGRTSCR